MKFFNDPFLFKIEISGQVLLLDHSMQQKVKTMKIVNILSMVTLYIQLISELVIKMHVRFTLLYIYERKFMFFFVETHISQSLTLTSYYMKIINSYYNLYVLTLKIYMFSGIVNLQPVCKI